MMMRMPGAVCLKNIHMSGNDKCNMLMVLKRIFRDDSAGVPEPAGYKSV